MSPTASAGRPLASVVSVAIPFRWPPGVVVGQGVPACKTRALVGKLQRVLAESMKASQATLPGQGPGPPWCYTWGASPHERHTQKLRFPLAHGPALRGRECTWDFAALKGPGTAILPFHHGPPHSHPEPSRSVCLNNIMP